MVCDICKNEKILDLKGSEKTLCAGCFQRMILKRIKKSIRRPRLLKQKMKIFIIGENGMNSDVLKKIIDSEYEQMSPEFVKNETQADLIFHSDTADSKINEFMSDFIEGDIEKHLKESASPENHISPMTETTQEEIEILAEIMGIKKESTEKDIISNFINSIDHAYHGTKYALMKSINELKRALK